MPPSWMYLARAIVSVLVGVGFAVPLVRYDIGTAGTEAMCWVLIACLGGNAALALHEWRTVRRLEGP